MGIEALHFWVVCIRAGISGQLSVDL